MTTRDRTGGRNRTPTILFAILAALILATVAHAASQTLPLSFTTGALNMTVRPTQVVCGEMPCIQQFNITVTNSDPKDITVSLYEQRGNEWDLVATLGNVSTGGGAVFAFRLSLSYNGLTTYAGKYALVSNTLKSKEFAIIQEWGTYETKSKDMLALGGYIVAPLIAIAIISVLSLVIRSTKGRSYGEPSEYTDKSLFKLPEGSSLGEKLASLLINPITWAVILALAILFVGIIEFSSYPGITTLTKLQILVISLFAAAAVPILLMTMAWFADIVDREPFRFMVGMFVWGVLAALMAFFINGALLAMFNQSAGALPLVLLSVVGSLIISPVVEEVLKALGLSIMSRHHEFDDALDGFLYGFAIGVGFAMLENWFYFIARVDPFSVGISAWVSVILYRSLFNTVAHGCFTGLCGVLIGILKSRDRFKQYYHVALLPGIFIAILLHIAFNFTAFMDVAAVSGYRAVLVSFNPTLVVAVAFVSLLVYSAAVWDSRKNKRPKL